MKPAADAFDPAGLSFLFTGKLASMTRAEAQAHAKSIGGTVASSASKSLGVLVIGDEGSPLFGQGEKGDKQRKVEALNAKGASIRIISEASFLALGTPAGRTAPPLTAPSVPLFALPMPALAPDVAPRGTAPTLTLVAAPGTSYMKAWCGSAVIDDVLFLGGGLGNDQLASSKDGTKFKSLPIDGRGMRSLLAVDGAIIKCGEYGSLARSADGFTSFKSIPTGSSSCLYGVALAPDGSVWVTGDKGFVTRSTDGGETFAPVSGIKGRVSKGCMTSLGLLLPSASGLYLAGDGTVTKLGLKKNVSCVLETSSGALVAVGANNVIFRSADGGAKFRAVTVPPFEGVKAKTKVPRASWLTPGPDLNVIARLPDGRLVVGGDDGVVLVSSDDGQTFTRVEHALTNAIFWAIAEFRGAVYLGGENGAILRVE